MVSALEPSDTYRPPGVVGLAAPDYLFARPEIAELTIELATERNFVAAGC
jgi:hypothetical protein